MGTNENKVMHEIKLRTAEEMIEKFDRDRQPVPMGVLLARAEAEDRAERSRPPVDLCREWKSRREVISAIQKHLETVQAINEINHRLGGEIRRLKQQNSIHYQDSELGKYIEQFENCTGMPAQIEKGLDWAENLTRKDFQRFGRVDSQEKKEIVFHKFDFDLGERCYCGDAPGLMASAYEHARARFQILMQSRRRGGGPIVQDVAVPVWRGPQILTNLDE